MANDNIVLFKGKRDGITIVLDESAEFSTLKDVLSQKAVDARKFFGGAKTSITFKGRTLSDEEESQLLAILFEETNLNISFVKNENYEKKRIIEDKIVTPKAPSGVSSSMEQQAYFHQGALRSGQAIRFPGSVVVLGDVNPGAEIFAEGNIIVLGALKGMVHAGCSGDSTCFVSAQNLSPIQLRISNMITYIPEDKKDKKIKTKNRLAPSYAYIHEGQIYIAPLSNS